MAGERGTLGGSLRFAARGVLDSALTQRNMRVHLVAAVLVATLGSAVMNSAIEATVDLVTGEPDERARRAKDAAAGAVLALAGCSLVVLALVVSRDWELVRSARDAAGRVAAVGLPLAALSAFLAFPFPRPEGLDLLAALAGGALLLPMALFSESLVFTGVAALAFAVSAAAAFERRGAE
jgi:diacylglycerol kinase (ATP)